MKNVFIFSLILCNTLCFFTNKVVASESGISIFKILSEKKSIAGDIVVSGYLTKDRGANVFKLYPYKIDADFVDATRDVLVLFNDNIQLEELHECLNQYVYIYGKFTFEEDKYTRQLHSIKRVKLLNSANSVGLLKTCWAKRSKGS